MRTRPVNQRLRIRVLQAGGVAAAALVLLTHPAMVGRVHEFIEAAGFVLVLACVAGRMWSILYVGSRKNRELVTAGPYSVTRNPLYLFSVIGAVGIGLIHGSLVTASLFGLLAYLVLSITAAREAEHLETIFGSAYGAYARRTPMFWPKLSLYREPDEVAFSPDALRRTFLDGLLFLAVFPAIETIETLQDAGYLPVILGLF